MDILTLTLLFAVGSFLLKTGEQRQRFPGRHPAGGQRPFLGAFDVLVEIAIGVVVDHATGRAHQHGAEQEHQQHRPFRPAVGRQPQRPQRRPEQQQDADRLVQPH